MIYPEMMKKGDIIGVTATSEGAGEDVVSLRKLESALEAMRQREYIVIETPDVRTNEKGRSAPARQRAEEFMYLMRRPDVKAIITAKGGDFLMEILPRINFNEITKNPKWIQGYSNTSTLLFCITTLCDMATMHGVNFGSFGMRPWHVSLENNLQILEGKWDEQVSFEQYEEEWKEEVTGTEPYHLTKEVKWVNAKGENEIVMEGRLLGGCIDDLITIVGTPFDRVSEFCKCYQQDGIVWYFDNFGLDSEALERALWQLKMAGWLQTAKGFVFGRPLKKESYYGITMKEAILEQLEELNVPIILDADVGHVAPQMTLVNGAYSHIECKEGKGRIQLERK